MGCPCDTRIATVAINNVQASHTGCPIFIVQQHLLYVQVDQATLQHSGFASAAVRDSHPQADALIQMHEAAATTTHQQHTTTDSLGVAAAVAAAAGALAAEGPEEAAGGAGQEQLRPHHQQQTQQVQVQVRPRRPS